MLGIPSLRFGITGRKILVVCYNCFIGQAFPLFGKLGGLGLPSGGREAGVKIFNGFNGHIRDSISGKNYWYPLPPTVVN